MTPEHSNIALMNKLDLRDLDGCAYLFAPDFVWHYFNRELPDLEGDYAGVDGLKSFFAKLAGDTDGTFKVAPLAIHAYGDELVVAHVRDTMIKDGQPMSLDALAIWRIVDGLIIEAWDIPAVNTISMLESVG
ncbi:nuclear transport factor 2 family protein [uncultured Ruegeria sp.]|uniref:nuclear transport factor 2 family protein n=1 Tax=uncultured Ruegeria sp. TaxID=259304 RepID=UPI00262D9F9B|nr:nuclear transport factor 2 family protein [uncultured Ruegeria sp.]